MNAISSLMFRELPSGQGVALGRPLQAAVPSDRFSPSGDRPCNPSFFDIRTNLGETVGARNAREHAQIMKLGVGLMLTGVAAAFTPAVIGGLASSLVGGLGMGGSVAAMVGLFMLINEAPRPPQ